MARKRVFMNSLPHWTVTLTMATVGWGAATAPCYATTFGLLNDWDIAADVNGAPLPIQIAGCKGCNGPLVQAPVPLTTTVSLSKSGDGGASSFSTMTDTADYGFLSVSGSGNATNSNLGTAFAIAGGGFVGGDPAASYTDTLHIVSPIGLPNGTPVTLLFTEIFAGNVTAYLPIGAQGFAPNSIFDVLQLPHATLELDQPGTMTVNVTSFIGDFLTFTDALHVNAVANANTLSPPGVTSTFSYSGTAPTFVTSVSPGVDIISSSGHNYAPVSSVPEPESYAMMLTGLGLLGFVARRRKQKETA